MSFTGLAFFLPCKVYKITPEKFAFLRSFLYLCKSFGNRCVWQANAQTPKIQVFWRSPQEIRTHAARSCPARRNNLPRAGQISYMPSRSLLHAVLIPVPSRSFPLSPLSIHYERLIVRAVLPTLIVIDEALGFNQQSLRI